MVKSIKTTSTTQAAKSTGALGKTTKSNQVVVSGAYMEVPVGGPYVRDKEEHPFGHAALHVVVIAHFDGIVAQQKEQRKKTASSARYVLPSNYHPTTNNCTTVTIAGAKISGKSIVQNPAKFNEMRGLSFIERQAARTQSSPQDGIFMPADLQAMLEANTEAPYDKKNVYK